MMDYTLSQEEISSLKAAHRAAKKKREADRIKTIILLGTGWTIREVAEVLLLDDDISFKEQKIENDDIVVFTDQTDEELIIGVIEASSKAQMNRGEKAADGER